MRASRSAQRASEAGFTVIEGLIAALLLAVILIGILPLIDRAKQNTLQGNDATYESNAVIDRLESLYSLPFNHPDLTVAAAATSLPLTDYFLLSSRTWTETTPTLSTDARYTRSSVVEYFSGADLEVEMELGQTATFDDELQGDALAGTVQYKRVTLEIAKQRALTATPYRVVAVKAY